MESAEKQHLLYVTDKGLDLLGLKGIGKELVDDFLKSVRGFLGDFLVFWGAILTRFGKGVRLPRRIRSSQ